MDYNITALIPPIEEKGGEKRAQSGVRVEHVDACVGGVQQS